MGSTSRACSIRHLIGGERSKAGSTWYSSTHSKHTLHRDNDDSCAVAAKAKSRGRFQKLHHDDGDTCALAARAKSRGVFKTAWANWRIGVRVGVFKLAELGL